MRGTFESVTGSSASRHAARIGIAPFLFPEARMRPLSGFPPSMTRAWGAVTTDMRGLGWSGAKRALPARVPRNHRGECERSPLGVNVKRVVSRCSAVERVAVAVVPPRVGVLDVVGEAVTTVGELDAAVRVVVSGAVE